MNWDDYFMGIAGFVAARSKDRSTKLGCVLVGPDNEIRSTGYNNFPRGINDDAPERHARPEKYFWTEHAERNAVYAAARVGTPLKGCRAYLPWLPCMDCARALVQSGIVEVVAINHTSDHAKYSEDFLRVGTLFAEAGVALRFVDGAGQ